MATLATKQKNFVQRGIRSIKSFTNATDIFTGTAFDDALSSLYSDKLTKELSVFQSLRFDAEKCALFILNRTLVNEASINSDDDLGDALSKLTDKSRVHDALMRLGTSQVTIPIFFSTVEPSLVTDVFLKAVRNRSRESQENNFFDANSQLSPKIGGGPRDYCLQQIIIGLWAPQFLFYEKSDSRMWEELNFWKSLRRDADAKNDILTLFVLNCLDRIETQVDSLAEFIEVNVFGTRHSDYQPDPVEIVKLFTTRFSIE